MLTENNYNKMQIAIEKAKRRVEKAYSCSEGERKWLSGAPPNSYNDTQYKVELFVLEGSPCKGYIIANYGDLTVRPFNAWGESLRIIKAN